MSLFLEPLPTLGRVPDFREAKEVNIYKKKNLRAFNNSEIKTDLSDWLSQHFQRGRIVLNH